MPKEFLMRSRWLANGLLVLAIATVSVLAVGCGDKPGEKDGGSDKKTNASNDDDHDHGGYWCVEHGIPEEACSMCSSKAADDFKAKGDWCEEHSRAESQCFKCDPSRAEKYAKLYEAKFGHAPPQPTE
jgi:hypothetical protein